MRINPQDATASGHKFFFIGDWVKYTRKGNVYIGKIRDTGENRRETKKTPDPTHRWHITILFKNERRTTPGVHKGERASVIADNLTKLSSQKIEDMETKL